MRRGQGGNRPVTAMRARDVSLTIAFCASLAVHTLLCAWMIEDYIRVGRHIRLPGYAPDDVLSYNDEFLLGDDLGGGKAVNAASGILPMVARRGEQDQAWLSRDPSGPGRPGDDPSMSVLPQGGGTPGAGTVAGTEALVRLVPRLEPAPDVPFGLPQAPMPPPPRRTTAPPEPFVDPALPASPPIAPEDAPDRAPEVAPAPPPVRAPEPVLARVAAGSAALAGAPARPADPAPSADSDSDPFSTTGTVRFRPGKVEARLGRRYRITRPRLDQVNQFVASTALARAEVQLRMRLDEAGNVVHVEILRSSGADALDQPCKVAAYQWWFDPMKDENGRIIDDVLTLTLRFF